MNRERSPKEGNQTRVAAFILVIGLLMVAASAEAATNSNKKNHIIDLGITDAIERRMTTDASVPSHLVDVATAEGIVTLSGSVDNLLAKERAVAIARTIRGVRSVTDQLTVKPVHRSDSDIRKDIEQALLLDPATDSYETSVKVQNGTATLGGTVQSWQEKNLVADVAKGVKGVKAVQNEMTVKYAKNRPDAEIESDIRGALKRNVWLPNGGAIQVKANQGKVELSGTVRSDLGKIEAQRAAWVMGVTGVDDSKLKVDPALVQAQRTKRPLLKDEEIEKAIADAFLFDPRVYSFQPQVEVDRGVVTLRGTVDNLKAKRAAEQDARNTIGVQSVRNHLKVRSKSPPSDSQIEKNIESAFARDPYVDNNEITVFVINGKAYLSGKVDTFFERWQADDIASRVNGVSDVQNNLMVEPTFTWGGYGWPYYSHYTYPYYPPLRLESDRDFRIEQDIEDQLFWSPFVDADEVNVTVDDGVATLTGTVDSYFERGTATDNAYQAGAALVKNELKVNND